MTNTARVTKSLKIDPNLWIEVKVHCAKVQKDISDFIAEAIQSELKKSKVKK